MGGTPTSVLVMLYCYYIKYLGRVMYWSKYGNSICIEYYKVNLVMSILYLLFFYFYLFFYQISYVLHLIPYVLYLSMY